MKKPIIFLAAITLSSAVFADNTNESISGPSVGGDGDTSSMSKNMNSMHKGMDKEATQAEDLKNKEIQHLHKEMRLYGLSERGMEARRILMSPDG